MDKNKLIENIKNQLKSLMTSEVKFAEIKAGDLVISSPDEDLMIGSEVFTVDQDGNNIPLGDGEYKLDSGEKITVVAGKVEAMVNSEITDAPQAVENETETEIEVEPEAEITEEDDTTLPEEEDMAKKDAMATLEARVAKCEKMLEEMSAANNKMAQALSAVAELPATKSISVEPAEFKSVEDKKSGAGAIDIMSIRERARKGR
jgi:hypothetical protein